VGVAALARRASHIRAIRQAIISQLYWNQSKVDKTELTKLCAILMMLNWSGYFVDIMGSIS